MWRAASVLSFLFHLSAWGALQKFSHHWFEMSIDVQRGRSSIQLISTTPSFVEEVIAPWELGPTEEPTESPAIPMEITRTKTSVTRGDPKSAPLVQRTLPPPEAMDADQAVDNHPPRERQRDTPSAENTPSLPLDRQPTPLNPVSAFVQSLEGNQPSQEPAPLESPLRLEVARRQSVEPHGSPESLAVQDPMPPAAANPAMVAARVARRPLEPETRPRPIEEPRPIARSALKQPHRVDATVAVNSSRSTGALGETPPQSLVTNRAPAYPAAAIAARREGTVVLLIRIRADGTVESIAVSSSSGSADLDQAAMDAVRLWTFRAARRGETSVASEVLAPIVFRLR